MDKPACAIPEGELHLGGGQLCKRAAAILESFQLELKRAMLQKQVLFWDDTVIMINTHRDSECGSVGY